MLIPRCYLKLRSMAVTKPHTYLILHVADAAYDVK